MKLSRLLVCSCRCLHFLCLYIHFGSCCGGWDQLTDWLFLHCSTSAPCVCGTWPEYRSKHQNSQLPPHLAGTRNIHPQPWKTSATRMNNNHRKTLTRVWIFKLIQQKVKQLYRFWSKWVSKHICMFNNICPFFMCRRSELSDICCFHTYFFKSHQRL